jgi:hypothetical protein
MRVNLIAKSCGAVPEAGLGRLSLTIRPACGLPGDYEYPTNSREVLQLLYTHTDLPAAVIRRFECDMRGRSGGRLLGVELSERVLTDVGYFID